MRIIRREEGGQTRSEGNIHIKRCKTKKE